EWCRPTKQSPLLTRSCAGPCRRDPLRLRKHGTHPDLHSFPTRRSSDLARRRQQPHVLPAARHLGDARSDGKGVRGYVRPSITEVDRKSTRLNCSHVGSSYVVLCFIIKSAAGKELSPCVLSRQPQASGGS